MWYLTVLHYCIAFWFLCIEAGFHIGDLPISIGLKHRTICRKIIEKTKDKIYIYVGITKNIEVAERLVNIYEKDNIKLSIIEKYLSNEELKNNIEQFDFLILSSNDKDEILKIEEVIMASYEEIINNNSFWFL